MQSKLGNLSGAALDKTERGRSAVRILISRRKFLRDSDAAIVSDDPVGHYNPLASQGPLDWNVPAMDPAILSERTIGVPAEGE